MHPLRHFSLLVWKTVFIDVVNLPKIEEILWGHGFKDRELIVKKLHKEKTHLYHTFA